MLCHWLADSRCWHLDDELDKVLYQRKADAARIAELATQTREPVPECSSGAANHCQRGASLRSASTSFLQAAKDQR